MARHAMAVSLALCLVGAAPARGHEPDLRGVDAAVQAAVSAGEVPGAVVLVGQGERVLYRKAFGARSLVPRQELMTEDTIFDVASLTKVVATTPAVLLLAEQGKLSLDDPLGKYLKEFSGRAFRDLTIRRILTHTAGFSDLPSLDAMREGFPRAAELLAKAGLQYRPGASFSYSDTGFIVLGELVRRVSGEPLDRFAAKHLFLPLGMGETTFRPGPAMLPRVAPTEALNSGMLRGAVHDGNARLLGGIAGHAGLFSTADDLARFVRMLLSDGKGPAGQVLKAATIKAMWSRTEVGDIVRALGWDEASPFSRPMGLFFPRGSVGHTGFTGTMLWMDPPSRTYLILLTNRVHPYGKGKVTNLRSRVAAEVAAALFVPPLPAAAPAPTEHTATAGEAPASPPSVLSGLDVLVAEQFALLAGRSVGLVTNQTGVDAQGRRGLDLLAAAPRVKLKAIFSPEHGLIGEAVGDVPHGRDPGTGLPVWSLYGAERRPTGAMLNGIDTLVVDLQDVGVRYYTYLTTLLYVLEEAARRRITVVVLDRPNPITGGAVEGPLMDPDLRSFTSPHPIPVRTGLTIGEFARMVAAERKIPVALTIVPLVGWNRGLWYDKTGLPWINPSPNIRSLTQALLYSGIGLLEATNLSVGRGTDSPFEVVGAPWIDPVALAEAMNRKGLAGVSFEPALFTPTADHHAGQQVGGVRLQVRDRDAIRPVTVALALAGEIRARYHREFSADAIQNLLVNRSTIWALLRGEPLPRLRAWAEAERGDFLHRRASDLIYR
ncbi:MAG: exo-beta-N-acetylmuramidase NamZ domain-containing protein [Candidatus Rokuibacteriota bacterium]